MTGKGLLSDDCGGPGSIVIGVTSRQSDPGIQVLSGVVYPGGQEEVTCVS